MLEVGQKLGQSDTYLYLSDDDLHEQIRLRHPTMCRLLLHNNTKSGARLYWVLSWNLLPSSCIESEEEVRTSDVLYLHEMLVSCYWPAKVPPAASVRVLTTEYLWWPAVQQCGVQCAVQTAASPPTRHHQDSVSRETGDVRTPRTSPHNTPLSPKHTTYPVWYLPPLSTECQILTTSRHAGPVWARGHNSPLPPEISRWEKIKQILSLHLTWQSAGGQACQCPLSSDISPISYPLQ